MAYEDAVAVRRCREIMRREGRTYVTKEEVENLFWVLSENLEQNILDKGGHTLLDRAREELRVQHLPGLVASIRSEGIMVC